MMRVKICGLCRPADAELAIALGATHLGCVVAPDSPRSAPAAALREIRELARDRAGFVLVVRGLAPRDVLRLAASCDPDLVQCHGVDAATEQALAVALPLLRVRRVAADDGRLPDTTAATEHRPFVLDGGRGGAGTAFDWDLLGGRAPVATFVAGGVSHESLPRLLAHGPWGIDVGSGVESEPGRKDPARMAALFAALEVRR